MNPTPHTPNPKPYTPCPKPYTLHPLAPVTELIPQILHPKPCIPCILQPGPQVLVDAGADLLRKNKAGVMAKDFYGKP
jgi:hypothetical protein